MNYDYTAKRLGSKQAPYNRTIIVCPKCGQRGTLDYERTNKVTGKTSISITHRAHLVNIGGLSMCMTDEWCSYVKPAIQDTEVAKQ